MKKVILLSAFAAVALCGFSQNPPENSDDRVASYRVECGVRRVISIPDIDEYKTFKGDFHMHTVFADATVSPKGRVVEAWLDGLDVIAMTEHIGVHKNKGIHLEDQNLPYRLAKEEGDKCGMIVIHGAEITRAKPFGHMNALFIKDSNVFSQDRYIYGADGKIKKEEHGFNQNNEKTLENDIKEMIKQGAFIQWNHPGWPDKKSDMYPIHEKMLKEGHIQGVELCNHTEWYPKVLDWFDQYHIPLMANSDIHMPTSYVFGRTTRPMTLVFAKEYTEESIKEAMFAGRMAAYWDNQLAGDAKYLEQLVHHSLKVKVISEKAGKVEVTNTSDIRYETKYGDHMNPVVLYPHAAVIMSVKKGEKVEFINCYIGRQKLKTNIW